MSLRLEYKITKTIEMIEHFLLHTFQHILHHFVEKENRKAPCVFTGCKHLRHDGRSPYCSKHTYARRALIILVLAVMYFLNYSWLAIFLVFIFILSVELLFKALFTILLSVIAFEFFTMLIDIYF